MTKIFKNIINNPAKTALTLHRSPDGDSIGSNLALFTVLNQKNHDVTIYSKDAVPDSFSYLPDVTVIETAKPSDIPWETFDRYIALDMGSADMLGEPVQFPESLEITTIDHHITNIGWGSSNIIDPSAISTSSILIDLFENTEIEITPQIATALLTGLATDSGFFVFQEDGRAFHHAAKLMEKGGDYPTITHSLLNDIPFEDLPFISHALQKAEIDSEKQSIIIPIDHELWNNIGISENKNKYLLHYLHKIRDTKLGILLIEEKPGAIRVELRSHSLEYDVSKLAKKLGGGGHKAASGASLKEISLDEAKEKILSLI